MGSLKVIQQRCRKTQYVLAGQGFSTNKAPVYCVGTWIEEFIFSPRQTCCSLWGAENACLWSTKMQLW